MYNVYFSFSLQKTQKCNMLEMIHACAPEMTHTCVFSKIINKDLFNVYIYVNVHTKLE